MTTCKPNFTQASNDLAYKLFQSLSGEGITCEEMDQGVSVNNLNGKECPKESMKTCVVGARDGLLDASEVFEFAFDRYEKYQKIIEGAVGRKLPWVLDDLDPTTTFDAEVRAKVQGAIDKIKGILKANGVKEGSDEYKEKLAVGLFYLAAVADKDFIQQNIGRFEEESDELNKVGLDKFGEYLKENGGGFRVEGDETEEYTTLEALQQQKGSCTENSKILFSIYKMAGLMPVFVQVNRDGIKSSDQRFKEYINKMPLYADHMCIGLSIAGKFRLFDTSLFDSNAKHDKYLPITSRQTFSYSLFNNGIFQAQNANWDEAIADYNEALKIDPKSASAYFNRGAAFAIKKNRNKAIIDFTNTLSINPKLAIAYHNRGLALRDNGELDRAIIDFNVALKINPKLTNTYFNLALTFVLKDQLSNATNNFADFLKLEPNSDRISLRLLDTLNFKQEKNPAAKKIADIFVQDTGLNFAKVETNFILSYSLWLATGQNIKSADMLKKIDGALILKNKPSPSTKKFFDEMLKLMPPTMAKDKQIAAVVKSIKTKLK